MTAGTPNVIPAAMAEALRGARYTTEQISRMSFDQAEWILNRVANREGDPATPANGKNGHGPEALAADVDEVLRRSAENAVIAALDQIVIHLNNGDEQQAEAARVMLRDDLLTMDQAERAAAVNALKAKIAMAPQEQQGVLYELCSIEGDVTALDSSSINESLLLECLNQAAVETGHRQDELIEAAFDNLAGLGTAAARRLRPEFSRVLQMTGRDFDALLKEARVRRVKFDAAPASVGPAAPATPRARPLTDLGNAERLVSAHGDVLRYVRAWGWLWYNGTCWERNDLAPIRFAKLTVRAIYSEAQYAADKAEREAIAAHAVRSESEARISAMVALAASDPEIEAQPEAFDADPMLLNFGNCTVDLRTGIARDHDPADLISKVAGTVYDPAATCPAWLKFLDQIYNGDAHMIDSFRRVFGYILTGSTQAQKFFFAHGGGSNGKSTATTVMLDALGDYGVTLPAETIMYRRNESIPNDVAKIAGARLVVPGEVKKRAHLNEGLVKDLTGGDRMTARFLHKEYFHFRAQAKLWLYGNHKPKISGTDSGIWRRVVLIPFTVKIEKPNEKLPDELRAELPGILAWAVGGCRDWQRDGLKIPDTVKRATADYRLEEDTFGDWLAECCTRKDNGWCSSKVLLASYKDYTGEAKMTSNELGRELRQRGFESKTMRGRGWAGIELVAPTPPSPEPPEVSPPLDDGPTAEYWGWPPLRGKP